MTTRKSAPGMQLIPIRVERDIHAGDDLAEELLQAFHRQKLEPSKGDILVVKHKIVSKAEGCLVDLSTVKPSSASRTWARRYGLDARVTEIALRESRRVIRRKRGITITETHHGFICANSGVDVSNVDGGRHALLLPKDPDKSAANLHQTLKRHLQLSLPVIISDSFGRPWREGLTEVAIGVAGMQPLTDYRGRRDSHGYPLHASVEAVADELACAAGLICGKLASTPACLVRGFAYEPGRGSAKDLIRSARFDLFR